MARCAWRIRGNAFRRKRGAGAARIAGSARRRAGLPYDLMVDGEQEPLGGRALSAFAGRSLHAEGDSGDRGGGCFGAEDRRAL